jgi:hypothetical protein
MSMGGGGGRKLSVARELLLLAGGIEALRLAAEKKKDASRPDQSIHRFTSAMAGGLLILGDRLRLVERILMGAANPSSILCKGNQANDAEEGPGVVPEWTAYEEAEHLAAELRGAEYRAEWERQGARPLTFVHHRDRAPKGEE